MLGGGSDAWFGQVGSCDDFVNVIIYCLGVVMM